MIFWIMGICTGLAVTMWCMVANNPQEDDYEDQMRAIEQWQKRKDE